MSQRQGHRAGSMTPERNRPQPHPNHDDDHDDDERNGNMRRSASTFLSELSLSPFALSLSPSVLSVAIYVLLLAAFVSPFFSISIGRSEFLLLTHNDWTSSSPFPSPLSPTSLSSANLAPTLFYLLYLLLCFALCIAVCLSLSFVTFTNSIAHESH